MGKSSAPAPDPRLTAAQIKSLNMQDALINQLMGMSSQMQPLQMQQMQQAITAQNLAMSQAQDDRAWALGRRGALTALQNKQIADAAGFDTEANRQNLAGMAMADVNQAFSNTRAQGNRDMSRMGVNPNDGRYAMFNHMNDAQQALAMSNAANKVRAAARQEGYQLTDRAANSLAGYPAMGMQATGAYSGYGLGGLNAANTGLAGMTSGLGTALSGAGQMGSNATGMYGTQLNAYMSAQNSNNNALGSIIGAVGTLGSSALGAKFGNYLFGK
jgi:hypothetical protein